MDKDKLMQYQFLKKEIKELESKIEKKEVVFDTVEMSNPYFPYEAKHKKIYGINSSKLSKLHRVLVYRKNKCEKLRLDIEEFIDGIEDSRTRLVFQLRYFEGLSWKKISLKLGSADESYSRKIHNRFIKKY